MGVISGEAWPVPDLGLAGEAGHLQLCAADTFAVPHSRVCSLGCVSQAFYAHLPPSSPLVSEMEPAGRMGFWLVMAAFS